ncbi:hypothetical protein F1542_01130 [Komagataeibacter sp. FXV3]|nr:hypothetical protein [Komagataeibacter sp. FXV3]
MPISSFDAVHPFPHDLTIHASYSQFLGRPAPGQIAMTISESCGDDGAGVVDCALTMAHGRHAVFLQNRACMKVRNKHLIIKL